MTDPLKAELRRALRQTRRVLHAARPQAGHDLVSVWRTASIERAAVVAVYRATGSEIDPAALADRLRSDGARIVLPVVVMRDAPLVFREAVEAPTAFDALGLPVPPVGALELRPDLLLLPLLGFDRCGGRIGQGGGYYDRTLAALRASGPPVRAIGLAFSGQEVDHVPREPCDERLDGVLTETAYVSCQ